MIYTIFLSKEFDSNDSILQSGLSSYSSNKATCSIYKWYIVSNILMTADLVIKFNLEGKTVKLNEKQTI